ncbi:TPA: phage holin family protein [Photobacterium damselae]
MILDYELAAFVSALSTLSGIGSYLHGRREGRLKSGFFECITEITLALVAGYIVAFAGEYEGIDPAMICAGVLLASNNGAEFIKFAKGCAQKLVTKFTGNYK